MAATRVKRSSSGPLSTSNESFYLGLPDTFKTLPTWEKILILASTYRPADSSRGDEGKEAERA